MSSFAYSGRKLLGLLMDVDVVHVYFVKTTVICCPVPSLYYPYTEVRAHRTGHGPGIIHPSCHTERNIHKP